MTFTHRKEEARGTGPEDRPALRCSPEEARGLEAARAEGAAAPGARAPSPRAEVRGARADQAAPRPGEGGRAGAAPAAAALQVAGEAADQGAAPQV